MFSSDEYKESNSDPGLMKRKEELAKKQEELSSIQDKNQQYLHNREAWLAFLNHKSTDNFPGTKIKPDSNYVERQNVMRRWLALFDYLGLNFEDLSHGGRVRMSCSDYESLHKAIDPGNILKWRKFASHSVKLATDGKLEESDLPGINDIDLRSLESLIKASGHLGAVVKQKHSELNLGLCADKKAAPANGSFGQLYCHVDEHDTSRGKIFSILIGVEGAAPGAETQFGALHSAEAVKNTLSATGAQKWEEPRFKEFIHINNLHNAIKYIGEHEKDSLEERYKNNFEEEETRLKIIRVHDDKLLYSHVDYNGYNSSVVHTKILPLQQQVNSNAPAITTTSQLPKPISKPLPIPPTKKPVEETGIKPKRDRNARIFNVSPLSSSADSKSSDSLSSSSGTLSHPNDMNSLRSHDSPLTKEEEALNHLSLLNPFKKLAKEEIKQKQEIETKLAGQKNNEEGGEKSSL